MTCVPLHTYRSGVTSLPKLKAQEYPGVTLVLVVLLGTKSRYLIEDDTRVVQVALSALFVVWTVLKRTWLDQSEVETKLPGITRR